VKCKLGSFSYPSDFYFLFFFHFGGDLERALACGFQVSLLACVFCTFSKLVIGLEIWTPHLCSTIVSAIVEQYWLVLIPGLLFLACSGRSLFRFGFLLRLLLLLLVPELGSCSLRHV
jgi:hypothetical protein